MVICARPGVHTVEHGHGARGSGRAAVPVAGALSTKSKRRYTPRRVAIGASPDAGAATIAPGGFHFQLSQETQETSHNRTPVRSPLWQVDHKTKN